MRELDQGQGLVSRTLQQYKSEEAAGSRAGDPSGRHHELMVKPHDGGIGSPLTERR